MLLTTDHLAFLIIIVSAMILDSLIGDPRPLPHPVRLMGGAIEAFERITRRIGSGRHFERCAGIVLVVVVVGLTFALSFAVQAGVLQCPSGPIRFAGILFLVYLAASTLALKELLKAGLSVITAVKADDMALARHRLSFIVGRDIRRLGRDGILRATIETLSENLSDGVIAPLFYLTLGGIPCALAYKAVNTLDSMVGHRNERYIYLGWASARLDDAANYLPARISALLIALAAAILLRSPARARTALITVRRDGRKHSSPNSGYPEASIAGALGVKLGGLLTYGGITVQKPYIGIPGGADYLTASLRTVSVIRAASYIGFLCAIAAISLGVLL
jgi:adenosylcobinamide-phosphate synthase